MATRIDSRDFQKVAEFVKDEADQRQDSRKDREKRWQEVDDQLAMDDKHIAKIRAKRTDNDGDWIPQMVLPHQSTALEVLSADCRRMMLPESTNWFECHADMTDESLAKLEQADLIGVEGRSVVGDNIDQEEMDAICEAVLQHNHRKYDVGRVMDVLNAEALKYGEFCGRVKEVRGQIFSEDFRGVFQKERRLVALVPSAMKTTYPDESAMQVMGEGLMIQPSWVRCYRQRIQDLKLAAAKGNSDPGSIAGGWMQKNVRGLEPETRTKNDTRVIEYEGDLIIPRSQGSIDIFNRIVTVAVGKDVRVIRVRDQNQPFRSYIHGVYHFEGNEQKVGPLLKAAPVHNALSEIFNRLLAAAIIHVEPPVSWPADDRWALSQGGLVVAPRAQWPNSGGEIKTHQIGDPQKLLEVFLTLLRMYEELTGVSAPRAGSQTKSHQTAFAIDQEVTRSQIRTVDYVRSVLRGPFANWLHMEWEMLRQMKTERVFVPKLGGYIKISGAQLPDVQIEVHGAAGPIEEAQEQQKRLQGLMMALNVEQIALQLGGKPIDVDRIREEFLREAGWSDPARFFKEQVSGVPDGTGEAVPQGLEPAQLLAAGGR